MKLKTQIILKDDRSLEVFLPQEVAVAREEKPKQRITLIKLSLLLVVLLIITLLTFLMLWDMRNARSHKIHFMLNGERTEDSVYFDQSDDTVAMWCGTDMTVTDLETGYNAYRLQLPGFNDDEPACFVTDRVGYDRHDIIDGVLNSDRMELDFFAMERNDTIEVEVDERLWEPDITPLEDISFLPRSIQRKCGRLPVYWIEPTKSRSTRGVGDEVESDSEEEDPPDEPQLRRLVYNHPDPPVAVRQLLPSNLRVDPGESDHGKDCCQVCNRPHVYCRNVCVPLRTNAYPYYYRNCNNPSCFAIFPCSYWYTLVTGQRQGPGSITGT